MTGRPSDEHENDADRRRGESRDDDEMRDAQSHPPADSESPGDRPSAGGLRGEIEEILREQGEKPVMPRPPRARGGGVFNEFTGAVRRMTGGPGAADGGSGQTIGALMKARLVFTLLRIAIVLALAFLAFRVLGPRALLLMIVITLAILALMTIRIIIARQRPSH